MNKFARVLRFIVLQQSFQSNSLRINLCMCRQINILDNDVVGFLSIVCYLLK